MSGDDLPFIDEHRMLVDDPADAVWRGLAAHLGIPRFSGSEVYGYLVAAEPRRASGAPLEESSTLPGWPRACRGRRVRLTGRYLVSAYYLTCRSPYDLTCRSVSAS